MDDTLLYQKPVMLLRIPAVVAPAILMTVIQPSCSMMMGFLFPIYWGNRSCHAAF